MFLLTLGACGVLDPVVERIATNVVLNPPFPTCPDNDVSCKRAKERFIADAHADSLMWGRDIRYRSGIGHTDYPRFVAGGVDLQIIGVPTWTPNPSDLGDTVCADPGRLDTSDLVSFFNDTLHRDSNLALTSAHIDRVRARAYRQFERFNDWTTERRGNDVQVITGWGDLDEMAKHDLSLMLSIEGLHWVTGDRDAVAAEFDRLIARNVRMVALTHRFTNDLAAASEDCRLVRDGNDPGLMPQGRIVLQEIIRLGLILDLAHASAGTIADVAGILRETPAEDRPAVMVSHGGIDATCDGPRNLDAASLRLIAKLDGVIAIGFWPAAVCFPEMMPDDIAAREQIAFGAVARALLAAAAILGSGEPEDWQMNGEPIAEPFEHLALGSDFDGAVKVPGDTETLPPRLLVWLENFECTESFRRSLPKRARHMCRIGENPFAEHIDKIAGQNLLRVLKAGLRESY